MSGPRIAVITPYFREPVEMLARAHRSVMAQGVHADHFMIADGHPLDIVDRWDVRHVRLDRSHDDYGNTPRGIGGLLARQQGYDFVAYLDADNWYHDGHLRSLLAMFSKKGRGATASFRTFHDAAGRDMGISEPAEDAFAHVDTSCLLLHRSAFIVLPIWLATPKVLSSVGDRLFLAALLHHKLPVVSTARRTVGYRSQYRYHFELAGLPVPESIKGLDVLDEARRFLTSPEGRDECVRTIGFRPLDYIG